MNIHDKTKHLISLLKLNREEIAEILGKKSVATISKRLNNHNFFDEKDYNKLLKYNEIKQFLINNIEII